MEHVILLHVKMNAIINTEYMNKANKVNTLKKDKSEGNKVKKDRVISVRVTSDVYDRYEVRCLENRHTMTKPIREAVLEYLN